MKTKISLFLCTLMLLSSPAVTEVPELSYVEGIAVSTEIEADLTELLSALRAEGLPVYLASGYRDAELTEYVSRRCRHLSIAFENTDHPTGLAVDLTDLYYEKRDEAPAETPTLQWLYAHSEEYGFTPCKEVSPWHFFYTGRVQAVAEVEKPCYNNKKALPIRESRL